jgi:hypothetical protein
MTPLTVLSPDFRAMPRELCCIPRWVVWKDAKVPYCATALNSKASVIEPNTWATFGQAQIAFEEGGYLGVGFVLSGDGIVGIDLDKCVNSGEPKSAAMALLERVGCKYIELSPSGTGLRGFGYGDNIGGTRGQLDGVNVELYAKSRYLTVTGRPIIQGPLVPLPGFSEVASAIKGTNLQKRTEDDGSNPLYSSVLFCRYPPETIPTEQSQRNRCLFALARYVKGTQPNATRQELRAIVTNWHAQCLSVIGTKDFAVTWTDFLNGWEKVRQPHGAIMQSVLETIDARAHLPAGIMALGYGTAGNQLVRVCAALQSHQGDEPFFISARQAGEVLGIHFTDASKIMAALVRDGVLKLVSKGAGKVASRYRFGWVQ